MLSILGTGHAHPKTCLDNALLRQIFPKLSPALSEESTGIKSRYTTLPVEYLLETGNVNLERAKKEATETPTELGFRAAEMALARAGIGWEDLGLVIGDCVSPLQTNPSEGQRIADRARFKVTSYDIKSSSSSLLLYLQIFSQWKPDRIPEYILCVSSNTPTHNVNYRAGEESFYFGDAASAMVLSSQHIGKVQIQDANHSLHSQHSDLLVLDLYSHLSMKSPECFQIMTDFVSKMLGEAFSKCKLDPENTFYIASHLHPRMLDEVCAKIKIPAKNIWHSVPQYGYTFGSAPMLSLSEHWEELKAGQNILIALAGPGITCGYSVLEVA